ncbi:Vegetative incompatibility protein HET-E-1 [Colletotrichum gloeosporioides]|uniref:Vegetative incompatibility protein HET-E-1 n=1 Tax=Colletotrichum gloeosporioides TaxID=474922 RepID=A0A8H4CQX8_COLGL|nr:Vegetative incompatibility protein HET-E-1 [Colletotrichum gloeosporioides]KAF3808513.1 Vegetative incompatibility protein HET-E-1 [Colletotrichum gloeosporioides]
MRLIDVETGRLEEFHSDTPSYAILSHTWGKDHEEISFQDMQQEEASQRQFGNKLDGFFKQARSDGHSYVWIDTCCIDKSNSVELGEAINSMYRWYKESSICYVYLADVSSRTGEVDLEKLHTSRWFTRGWTLQELLAPRSLRFYDCDWCPLGEKNELAGAIRSITGIPYGILLGFDDVSNASVAQRMSWAAKRVTKRKEDLAYCLLGIFDVMMPMIYGEEEHAFIRLQEEIIKKTADDSILAWGISPDSNDGVEPENIDIHLFGNALATSPAAFMHSGNIVSVGNGDSTIEGLETARGCLPLRLRLSNTETGQAIGFLNCQSMNHNDAVVGIPLLCITPGAVPREYIRPAGTDAVLRVPPTEADSAPRPIRLRALLPSNKAALSQCTYGFHINQWSELLKTDLSVVDTYSDGQWNEDRAVISTVMDIRHNAARRSWWKVRQKTGVLKDFVIALELGVKQMEVHASCHLMVASRDTALDIIARATVDSDGFLGSRIASNDSLTLGIKLSQDLPGSKLYMVTLATPATPSQLMDIVVDADQELKILAHTDSLLKLFAKSWPVSLNLSGFKKPLEGKEQAQDPLFLDLLGEKEAIQSQISLESHSIQELMADLQLSDTPSTDNIPKIVRRAFILAITGGHTAAMEYLWKYLEVDNTIEDSEGRGALSLAVAADNIPVLESLLSKGFAVNRSDSCGQSPLSTAALLGHHAALLMLLKTETSISFHTRNGQTLIDVAVKANHCAVVRTLLEKGADVRGGFQNQSRSRLTAQNEPPLAVASRLGFAGIVECLLQYGANVNEKGLPCLPNSVGFRADCPVLAIAAYMGHHDVVNCLLSRKADVNATDGSRRTPLLLAARNGHDQIVRLLLQQGADTELSDSKDGGTPLAFASTCGHRQVVALLLEKGANLEAKDFESQTPIFHAIHARRGEILQLLLSRGADVNVTQNGETPLFYAIRYTEVEAVDLLVKHGARISTENKFGKLPLQYAQDQLTRPINNLNEFNTERRQLLRAKREEIIRRLESATVEHDQHAGMTTKPTLKSRAQKTLVQLIKR